MGYSNTPKDAGKLAAKAGDAAEARKLADTAALLFAEARNIAADTPDLAKLVRKLRIERNIEKAEESVLKAAEKAAKIEAKALELHNLP